MAELVPTTVVGQAGLHALLRDPGQALIAFDYDGTLAPIVDDPAAAGPEPGVVEALARLGERVGNLAIITGRPAREAVELGGLDGAAAPASLVVLGHYGVERWDSATGELTTADPPEGLALVRRELAGILEAAGVPDAVIEDKGLAVAVHVRRCASPAAAYRSVQPPLLALAQRAGLVAEPGRHVIELRPPGMNKGRALSTLMGEVEAGSVMFTGDDLGDLAAFDAVDARREQGGAGLLVCSGSTEVTGLSERADLVVDGPPGVRRLVEALVALLDS